MNRVLKIHEKDNVITALIDLHKDDHVVCDGQEFTLKNNIPAKHKIFIKDLNQGDEVIMHGVLVGKMQDLVHSGDLMTTGNVKHAAEPYSFKNVKYQWQAPDISRFKDKTFKGYKRKDGNVGTANYWLFIPTVFCENRNMDVIKDAMLTELGYSVNGKYKKFAHHLVQAFQEGKDISNFSISDIQSSVTNRLFQNIDGVKFLNHTGGCGGTRQDAASLSQLLAAYADHPNVGGVTVLSLGCQHLQVQQLKADIYKRNPSFDKPLLVFEQQQLLSEEKLVSMAMLETFKGLIEINKSERESVPLSKLCVGVKCGGSDGFSGISANPAVGYTSDLLVALGAKVLLAEFPELCGAEQNLIDRCTSEANANKFIRLMKEYDAQAHAVGSGFYMNPSPGNIKDGLITDAIKSAGAAKKGGTSPVTDVLDYTEPATKPGLSLVCTPGNDVEATTGKAAAGATLILFTTGLGTPTGNPVCPTIKIATNSSLATRMNDIIDVDCGPIIRGEKTIQQMGEDILEYCIKAASGEVIPKAVQLNQDDFIPWKRGVSL
ncbi:MAG: altronate dehydratase [Chitinophagaceae bacterium]|nr:altronate dehydratase [Chitinophagaceae bacterium]